MPSSLLTSNWASTPSGAVSGGVFSDLVYRTDGMAVLRIKGKKAYASFRHEAGGHRWQRVPPTEKRGRVHTSTITVAVLPVQKQARVSLAIKDVDIKTCRGSGAGGQHRNTTDSAVQATHIPTGLSVRIESERSQHQNRQVALEILQARLADQANGSIRASRADKRKRQLGSGQRGDKRRTIALQRGTVFDHKLGRSVRAKAYQRGDLSGLYD